MLITTLAVGPLATNCYIVADDESRECLIIDPAGEAGRILDELRRLALVVKYVVNTHGHLDHVLANDEVRQATGAPLLIHEADAPFLARPDSQLAGWLGARGSLQPADRLLHGGEKLTLGNEGLEVLATPGHTPGGITLYAAGIAFTGDALFHQGVGRTDLPGGSWRVLQASIEKVLFTLPGETVVYPGHGPSTTIADERSSNPYL
ncbi:MAG: MBL fold metallo-hydrolase [Chloroflexota bacterium]